MAGKQSYLKSKNARYLWLFVGVNTAVFLSVVFGEKLTYSAIEHRWHQISAKDGLIAVCIPLATIVLNGFLGHLAKARIVFWRWRNPLPGCRVFSKLMSADPRVDAKILKAKYGQFPKVPGEQNALWYRLYKAHVESVTVSEAHKAYLLTRDMAAFSTLFVVLFLAGGIAASVGTRVVLLYCAFLVSQYLVLSTSARNYGNRFVLNVLAEASRAK